MQQGHPIDSVSCITSNLHLEMCAKLVKIRPAIFDVNKFGKVCNVQQINDMQECDRIGFFDIILGG